MSTMNNKSDAIVMDGLVKRYGEKTAVDGISLSIAGGSVFGLLGPNGAGKTTTVRLLATLIAPDDGRATVLGLDLVKQAALIRQKVSLTGQFASVDEELSGLENLILIGRLLGHSWQSARSRAKELLKAFDLEEAARRQVITFSGGMRRRLDIAASLIVTPEILFLDEPTTGLDPRSRNQVWDIVRAIAAEGATVLLTTQYLEEADQLANRLAVIDHGKVIAGGTSRELKASVGTGSLTLALTDPGHKTSAINVLRTIVGEQEIVEQGDGSTLSFTVESEGKAIDCLSALTANDIGISEFSLGAPSLDEVFFAITGKPVDEHNEDAGS